MVDSIKILKKAYFVVHTDNELDTIYMGDPHVNKKSAQIEMNDFYRKSRSRILADGETIDSAWIDKNGYSIQTASGAHYHGNIIMADLTEAKNLKLGRTAT